MHSTFHKCCNFIRYSNKLL